MAKKGFETFELENGANVLLVPKKDSLATTVLVTATVGSKYEEKDISGISHFLEHMGFKGTENRPSPEDIAKELEGLGSQYNAYTSQEMTGYYAKVRNKHFDKALEIISDMYINSTLPEEEMEKERNVILEEINMYEDSPSDDVRKVFLETIYGDQPAGWSVAGRKEVIKNLNKQDLLNYRNKHYNSENTIITISGGYNPKDIKDKIESYFSKIKKSEKTNLPPVKESQESPNETIKFKDSDQAHVILGFRAFDAHNKNSFPLKVLSAVLGSGMSSRLFREIREKRGLAYYIYAYNALLTNNGFVATKAGLNKNKIEEAIKIILNEFQKIKEEVVSDEEIERAKEFMIGNMFLSLEDSSRLARYYTTRKVRNLNLLTPKKIEEKINNVTKKEVKSVANNLFTEENLNLAVIGPFKNKSFGDILKIE